MPNTRSSAKRTRQALTRSTRNRAVKSQTKTILKKALLALKSKDVEATKSAYKEAVSALDRAASKNVFPKARVSRKIARLTRLVADSLPDAIPFEKKPASSRTQSAG